MPIYEYSCLSCEADHEIIQKISDAPLTICPSCGGELKKKISNSSFVLKGTGWYATDYAGKGNNRESGKEKAGEDKKPKDAAPEGKKDSPSGASEPVAA